jgi:hypothetical protein
MTLKPWALAGLALLQATPLYAAEEGGGPLAINTALIIWTFLIFGIVLVVLSRTAWPAILGAVEQREAHIRELLEGAERDRAAAAAAAEENRRLLEETRAKAHEAINEARLQGEAMRAEVLATSRWSRCAARPLTWPSAPPKSWCAARWTPKTTAAWCASTWRAWAPARRPEPCAPS